MKKSSRVAAAAAGARKPSAAARPVPAQKPAPKRASPSTQPAKKRVKTATVAAYGPDAPTRPGATKPPKPPKLPKPAKAPKPPKSPKRSKKLEVRLLIDDLARLDALKQRAADAGRRSKRSELMRAGLVLLQGLDPLSLCDALEALPVRRKPKPVMLGRLLQGGDKKGRGAAR